MKVKICGIYKITSPTNCIYIGQSVNIHKRWVSYKKYLGGEQRRLTNSFKKHGFENHIFEIIEECSRELLNEKEVYWIKFYDTFDTKHGMNLTSGGNSPIFSQETRKKISESNTGKKRSAEAIEKYRKSSSGRPVTEETKLKIGIGNKGKKLSEEAKLKVSEFQLGRPKSEETKLKMSLTHKNKKFSQKHLNNIKISNQTREWTEQSRLKLSISMTGKTHSEEAKKKMSLASKGKSKSENTKLKMRKPKTREHKENISKGNLGKKMSEESILKRTATRKRNAELKSDKFINTLI